MDDYGHSCSESSDCTLPNLHCSYPDCAKGRRVGIHAAIGKPSYVQSPDFIAGFKAGREAGMREAAELCEDGIRDGPLSPAERYRAGFIRDAILSAIGGGK